MKKRLAKKIEKMRRKKIHEALEMVLEINTTHAREQSVTGNKHGKDGKVFIDTLMLPPCLVPSYRHRPMMNSHRAFFIYRRILNEQYRNQHRHLPDCQKADRQDNLYRPCPFQRDRQGDDGGQNQAYAP